MRIVSWNCGGAFRRKRHEVECLEADVLVIQETEDPSRYVREFGDLAETYVWTGENSSKGLGIFARKGNVIERLAWDRSFTLEGVRSGHAAGSWRTADLKHFLPVRVNGNLTIIGAWTKGSSAEAFGYIGQFWKFIQLHAQDLRQEKSIVVGDFNSNTIWDKRDRWWNHSDVVRDLEDLGLFSLYHHQYLAAQGKEPDPTFFLHRNYQRRYHIDYAFLSSDLLEQSCLEIGDVQLWTKYSDHLPLIIDID